MSDEIELCNTSLLQRSIVPGCGSTLTKRGIARHAGLDARAAAIVMRVVRNIVNTGRTIACTIHQPAIDIFEVRPLQ